MAEQSMRECVARVCCKSYGDEYDEQPKDLAALRAERSRQRGGKPFTVDGVEHDADTVFAYDPGLPTQADWLEMADAVLAEIETPTAGMTTAYYEYERQKRRAALPAYPIILPCDVYSAMIRAAREGR